MQEYVSAVIMFYSTMIGDNWVNTALYPLNRTTSCAISAFFPVSVYCTTVQQR